MLQLAHMDQDSITELTSTTEETPSKKEVVVHPWARAVGKYDNPEKEDKFKNKVGSFKTSGLFLETSVRYGEEDSPKRAGVLYTLKDEDYKGYPALRRLYLEAKDPTEYQFANQCFYSWEHWCLIREQEWIKPKLAKWREELKVLILSEALTSVVEEATNPISRSRLSAAKYLLESEFGALLGMPTSKKELKAQEQAKELSADEKRFKAIQDRASQLLKEKVSKSVILE